MVLHYLQEAGQEKKNRLIEILKKKTDNQKEIDEAIKLLVDAGSLAYARNKMFQLIDSAWKEIE